MGEIKQERRRRSGERREKGKKRDGEKDEIRGKEKRKERGR